MMMMPADICAGQRRPSGLLHRVRAHHEVRRFDGQMGFGFCSARAREAARYVRKENGKNKTFHNFQTKMKPNNMRKKSGMWQRKSKVESPLFSDIPGTRTNAHGRLNDLQLINLFRSEKTIPL